MDNEKAGCEIQVHSLFSGHVNGVGGLGAEAIGGVRWDEEVENV